MTTNQTIDGVPRELIERIAAPMSSCKESKHHLDAVDELRALLDAPAFDLVEPVAPWFYFVECDDPDYSGLFNHESEAQTQASDHGGKVVRLWNVPPAWKPAAQPQGEPVARRPDAIIEGVMTSVGISHAIYASTVTLKHGEQVKLYAEQLAPVKVDEMAEFTKWTHEVIAESRIGGVTLKVQRKQHLTPGEERSAHDAWMARSALNPKPR